jgi:hypothetical protein
MHFRLDREPLRLGSKLAHGVTAGRSSPAEVRR